MLAQTMTQEAWDAVCAFGEMAEFAFDPRFNTSGKRLGEGLTDADSDDVRAALRAAFARKTAAEWETLLQAQPEVVWDRVRAWPEVLTDEQNLANGYLNTVEVPGFGPTTVAGNLVTMSDTPSLQPGVPVELGEANGETLAALGFDAADIEAIETQATKVREAALAELLALSEMS